MIDDIQNLAMKWVLAEGNLELPKSYYCESQDIFQAKLDAMVGNLLAGKNVPDNDIYVISAIAGEIGNNSFDHNIGNWPDVRGIFFSYQINADGKLKIVLADRGRGVMETLKQVKPEIETDEAALKIAFFERISGRAPESRGNGLKFVRENIKDRQMHLTFMSGDAVAELNQDFKINQSDEKMRGCLAIIKMKI